MFDFFFFSFLNWANTFSCVTKFLSTKYVLLRLCSFLWQLGKKNILNWFEEFSIGWMTFGNYPDNLHFFWQINFSLLLGHVKKIIFAGLVSISIIVT